MAEEILLSDQNIPQASLQDELTRLYSQGFLTDITLSTEDGKNFEAHRILLAARSNYFYSVVPRLKSDAVIFLKGIKGAHLDKILKYIYSGSVALSRHQLKPILEVAKSLQVKGLCDANPSDILSKAVQPGASSAAVAAMANRFKQPGTPPSTSPMGSMASMRLQQQHQLQQQQQQQMRMLPPSSFGSSNMASSTTLERNTLTNFKNQGMTHNSSPSKSVSGMTNGSDAVDNSDSDDEKPSGNKAEDEEEEEDESPPKPKRKRGRPPKLAKKDEKQQKGKEQWNDPYEFELESNADPGSSDEQSSKKGWRGDKKKYRQNHDNNENDDDNNDDNGKSSSPQPPSLNSNNHNNSGHHDHEEQAKQHLQQLQQSEVKRFSKYATSSINGKQVLTIQCKSQTAELHLARFANGFRGRCIYFQSLWITPHEFEVKCGITGTGKKYLENIQTDYGPLKALTASGMLKPHSRKCRCSTCRDGSPKITPEKLLRQKKQSTVSENDDNEMAGDDEEKKEEGQDEMEHQQHHHHQQQEEEEDQDLFHNLHEDDNQSHMGGFTDGGSEAGFHNMSGNGSSHHQKKRKKKKRMKDEWRLQLADQLRQQQQHQQHQQQQQQQHQQHQHMQQHIQLTNAFTIEQTDHPQIQMSMSQETLNNLSAGMGTVVMTTTNDQPKMSPSVILSDRIEPPQHIQPPTFYVMSPHPHMQAPPTPHHNPFASVTPAPTPGPPQMTQLTQLTQMSPMPIMTTMAQPKPPMTPQHHQQQQQQSNSMQAPASKLAAVLNVRCKSTTALLYTNKYETGSKGKCIQLGDEWLTPNEFEERAGSKAKKYLSSIKCMGRPLRVYVNSGELRGSGPPPHHKMHKKQHQLHNVQMKAPSAIQPIAPAPPPTPIGMGGSMQGPPTPQHISNAPSLPPNLNMILNGGPHNHQPPILINQTSMASSMMGSQQIITAPMTFTLAQHPGG